MSEILAPPVGPVALPVVPPAELAARAVRFSERLEADGLDGAFLLHPSSAFWISGTLSQGWPYVGADGGAWLPLRTSLGRAERESPLPRAAVPRPADLPGALADLGARVAGTIGVEMDVVPVIELERLRKAFPEVEFRDVSRAIREVRAVKSDYEIGWIERAPFTNTIFCTYGSAPIRSRAPSGARTLIALSQRLRRIGSAPTERTSLMYRSTTGISWKSARLGPRVFNRRAAACRSSPAATRASSRLQLAESKISLSVK